MNSAEALVMGVGDRDGQHDHEGREHERHSDRSGAERAGVQIAQPHRDLRGQWARHRLTDREALLKLGLRVPAALLDEIALHVADQCDRATEPRRAELEEVAHEPGQRSGLHDFRGRSRRRGARGTIGRWVAHEREIVAADSRRAARGALLLQGGAPGIGRPVGSRRGAV
ncbi:MAG: hypothetical protein WKF40_09495 [Thermoleophilaceae bacterium]